MATRSRSPATAPPPSPADWRSGVAGASGLNIVAGIWLVISPWVLNFHSGDSYWNPVISGAVVAILALFRVTGAYRESSLSWINVLIGAWLFTSGWWLADSAQAQWNDWIMGVVVFVFGVISAGATEEGIGRAGPRRPVDADSVDRTP